MKYIKFLVSSLFILTIFAACSQKDVNMVNVQIDDSLPLHSKIIAVERSK